MSETPKEKQTKSTGPTGTPRDPQILYNSNAKPEPRNEGFPCRASMAYPSRPVSLTPFSEQRLANARPSGQVEERVGSGKCTERRIEL